MRDVAGLVAKDEHAYYNYCQQLFLHRTVFALAGV